MSTSKEISLGAFLCREHGITRSIISTTIISELDGTRYDDEWCLVGGYQANHERNPLAQRVNVLERTTQQLLARIDRLEKVYKESPKSLPAPSSKPKAIEYHPTECNKKKSLSKLSGKSLKSALISQRKKILQNKKSRKKNGKIKNFKKKRTVFQQELADRVKNPSLKETWHLLKARKVEDPHAAALKKLRQEMMAAKSLLKCVPSPDCKTVIVLD